MFIVFCIHCHAYKRVPTQKSEHFEALALYIYINIYIELYICIHGYICMYANIMNVYRKRQYICIYKYIYSKSEQF